MSLRRHVWRYLVGAVLASPLGCSRSVEHATLATDVPLWTAGDWIINPPADRSLGALPAGQRVEIRGTDYGKDCMCHQVRTESGQVGMIVWSGDIFVGEK